MIEEDKERHYAERYSQLPEETRDWLERLREEDIENLQEAIKFYEQSKTIGNFGKWVLLLVIGIFVTGASLGESISKIFGWVRGH